MGSYTAGTFDSSASINGSTLIKDTDEQMAILMTDTTSYLNTEFNKIEVAVNDSLTDFDNLLQPSVDSATASARIAQQAAFVASSAQNFKGTWTNQTTAVGQSWEYQSKIYAVLIAGNTSPLVSPSNWLILNNFITKVTSTDNALARFNGTTGEVQDSGVIVTDSGNLLIGTTTDNGVDKLQVNGSMRDIDISRRLTFGDASLVLSSIGTVVSNLSALARSGGNTGLGLYVVLVSIQGDGEHGIWPSKHTFTLAIDAGYGSLYAHAPVDFIAVNSTFFHRTIPNPFSFYTQPDPSSADAYTDTCLGVIGDDISRTFRVTIKKIVSID